MFTSFVLLFLKNSPSLARIFWCLGLALLLSFASVASILKDRADILRDVPYLSWSHLLLMIFVGLVIKILLYYTVYLVSAILLSYGNGLIRLRASRKRPEARLFFLLSDILQKHVNRRNDWNNLGTKRDTILQLEQAANVIEGPFIVRLSKGSLYGRMYAMQQFSLISRLLRSKILWIVTPTGRTREDFIQDIRLFISILAIGNWDALVLKSKEQAEIGSPIATSIKLGIIKICRSIFIAAAPFCGLWLYQYFNGPFGQPMQDYARMLSIVWALLYLVSEIDPRWSERLSGAKEVINILRPSGGKSDKD